MSAVVARRPEIVFSDADISECVRFRYELRRAWCAEPDWVHFCDLNPSTADANRDDPTIRREIGYAQAWGFGGLIKTNLYGLCSTDPEPMWLAADRDGDPRNLEAVLQAAQLARFTVCAWGCDPRADIRARKVTRLLRAAGADLRVLRLNKAGRPWHPLYLPASLQPVPWEAARAA